MSKRTIASSGRDVRKPVIAFAAVAISVILFLNFFPLTPPSQGEPPPVNPDEEQAFTFTLPDNIVQRFGCYYPITFIFTVPSGTTTSASYSYGSTWIPLTKKTASDFYIGESCYRIDGLRVLVSAPFAGHSKLYLKLSKSASFSSIAKYYDDSKCVVVTSHDDYASSANISGGTAGWNACVRNVQLLQQYKVFGTLGVVAGRFATSADWAIYNTWLQSGFIETGSHSWSHNAAGWSSVNHADELSWSRNAILSHLQMPSFQGQYVLSWLEPFGNAWWPSELATYNYLVSRSTGTYSSSMTASYEAWDGTIFTRAAIHFCVDGPPVSSMKASFDLAYSNGALYHVYWHPMMAGNDFAGFESLLQYIGGRSDVWYTGLGLMYVYRVAALSTVYKGVGMLTWMSGGGEIPKTPAFYDNLP